MAIRGLGQALGILGQGMQQKAQIDWQEQRQANLERIRAEERSVDRADRKAEFDQEIKYRNEQSQKDDRYRQQSLEQNARQHDATMAARKEEQDYIRVAGAYESARMGAAAAQKQLEAALKMRPEIDPITGMPINDPSFGATRKQAIDQAQKAVENARVQTTKSYRELNSRFRQYQKYFDATPTTPPLLQRPYQQ